MGRLELGFHGIWGSVCSSNIGTQDAHFYCRLLGFDKALLVTHKSAFGRGVGIVWDMDGECSGRETTLDECLFYLYPAIGSCLNHVNDLGVICEGGGDLYRKFHDDNNYIFRYNDYVHITEMLHMACI